MVAHVKAMLKCSYLDNFLMFHPILIKFASNCLACQELLFHIQSWVALSFPLFFVSVFYHAEKTCLIPSGKKKKKATFFLLYVGNIEGLKYVICE